LGLGLRARLPLALAVLLALVLGACGAAETDGLPSAALRGATVEVLAVWSGAEQARFEAVLDEFERQTGVTVTYTSAGHGVAPTLNARLAEGRPPDVAFLPQPGLLRGYAGNGVLVPLDDRVRREVVRNYSLVWRGLASAGGQLYGVPFKAANKSLVWYDIGTFQRAGVVPPTDVNGLLKVERTLAAAGTRPYSIGGADGWTLTDWFENLYLRSAGTDPYDQLAAHRLAWTDESVTKTLALMLDILAPSNIAGGVDAALATKFEPSVVQAFQRPGGAAMVCEGDFVAGVITARTDARVGVDVDVFPFPAVAGSGPAVVGGGDLAVLMRESPAGAALMRYLATPEAAARWAAAGGFISPNLNLDLSVYPDPTSRALARSLLDAGEQFRFDLSDLTPSAFGGTEGKGMRLRLQDLLRTQDVAAPAVLLEADAAVAYGP
jgi:ABC-type glycerol-3-phosphate transport system substrate-binding protein